MSLWDDLKSVGAGALNNAISTVKKTVQTEAQKAQTKLLPSVAADAVNAFNGLFRQIKNRVVDQVAETPAAQEVKQREIEKMFPMIALGAAALLIIGVVIAVMFRGK